MDPSIDASLAARLRDAGMADVPDRFSIAPVPQEVPERVLAEIDAFIRVFDHITTAPTWQQAVTASSPEIARSKRSETCFFSAWDFHLPPDHADAWQLIECNDNGSGLMFAALINHHYAELAGVMQQTSIEPPLAYPAFEQRVIAMIRREADAFFGGTPLPGSVLILDDPDSLEHGRFRHELVLVRDLCRRAGWSAEIATPSELRWDGAHLLGREQPVAFVVNRSTDFFWEGDELAAMRSAYANGNVYVAPNPFTYATRSDKRLMELLSNPDRDGELGIDADERAMLNAHIPQTRTLRLENADELARDRDAWFFKPSHGFASHGVLPGAQVGRERLHRLLKKGASYVAQRRAPKARLETRDGVPLWVDLRVWAYRGERLMISGRASRTPDRLDLTPPGGWIPTYGRAG